MRASFSCSNMQAEVTEERLGKDDEAPRRQKQHARRGCPKATPTRPKMAPDVITAERKGGGDHPDPRWRRRLRRVEGREAQGASLPSFEMAAAVGAVPGPALRPQPRLLRPSHRPLAVPSPGGGARARTACSWHLTWRQRRQLQRPRGMGALGAGPEPAKPAARGRRRARGLWPRRTWSSTMW